MFWERGNLSNLKLHLVNHQNPQRKTFINYQQHICHPNCQNHLFSLRTLQWKEGQLSKQLNNNLQASFCPKKVLGVQKGGCPRFNNDGLSDTPSFINKNREEHQPDQIRFKQSLQKAKRQSEILTQRQSQQMQKLIQIEYPHQISVSTDEFIQDLQTILNNRI